MKSKREFGITIIELLSCIVILAILASLLFPVFSRAKLESKTAAAKLNLKQLHLTLTLYRLDYF